MTVPSEVVNLVKRFSDQKALYLRPLYSEDAVRRDFLDPLFRTLGWDVGNTAGLPESSREVVTEMPLRIEGRPRRPDYAMRIGPVTRFFVEAKKPSVRIDNDPKPALQLRRYGWNAALPFSILTDFHEFAVYDTRVPPVGEDSAQFARLQFMMFDTIPDQWSWIAERFSREAVIAGSLDDWAKEEKPKASTPVDQVFLRQLSEWRKSLARAIAQSNGSLSVDDLNAAVQTTMDRVIFLRICEDRGIEAWGTLQTVAAGRDIYADLVRLFLAADSRYNSGLFHFGDEKGRRTVSDRQTLDLLIPDSALRSLIDGLYPPNSPFDFTVLGAEILGSVYEQFLGEVINLGPTRQVRLELKPEVKKAGGVVYTPQSVVRRIIDHAVAPLLEGKTIEQVSGAAKDAHPVRIVDPACGSGSFLIEVYQHLLDWYLDAYTQASAKWSTGRDARIYAATGGGWRLTASERKRILRTHVFGVDLDAQAVEVTKLSLLLKVLEFESAESLDTQLALFHERALPDLDDNIKCGNALIDASFEAGRLFGHSDVARDVRVFSWEASFPEVFDSAQGFDAVVGNPPYVLLQDQFRDEDQIAYFKAKYSVVSYKVDLYHLFLEKSLRLAMPGGYVALITPTNYLTNNHLGGLRRLLLDEASILEVGVLDSAIFRGRSVDCAILVAKKQGPSGVDFPQTRLVPGPNQTLIERGRSMLSPDLIRTSPSYLFTGRADGGYSDIWRRVEEASVPLETLVRVNFGKQLRNRKHFTRDVIEDVEPDGPAPRGYARCYTGADVARWHLSWGGRACLTTREAQMGGCWDDEAQLCNPKLVCRQVGFYPDFAMDRRGYQCLNTMFMITPKAEVDLFALLGVLNSTVLRAYWLDHFWDQRRTFPKIKGSYLKLLPVPDLSTSDLAGTSRRLVEAATLRSETTAPREAERLTSEMEALEAQVDHEVTQLFGLSAEDMTRLKGLISDSMRVLD